MRNPFKLNAAVTLSFILLVNPLLCLASGKQKELPKLLGVGTFNYAGNSRNESKPLKPLSSRGRAGTQVTTSEGQSVTLLPDGRQLLVGGQAADGPQSTASIKDPRTNEIVNLSTTLLHPRAWHTATMLPEGMVLILGGIGSDGKVIDDAEVFDLETERFEILV